jgi:tetratricopeptide (TPR) repeat protein
VVRQGPRNPYFKYALPKLVSIAQINGNDTELLRIVDKIPPEQFPRQAKNHLSYLMGRKLYEDGELSEALRFFQQVSPRSDLYMRSKYFEGVIHNERSKYKSAVKAFRDVYQAEVPATDIRSAEELEDLQDLALLNIARIYYGLERFDNADNYYSLVSRDSLYWPQSLFERSWATFMQNDLNLTLGLLLTVRTPYYADYEFLPEATVLRALTFFSLCEYDEVERILLQFEDEHRPMRDELREFLGRYSTEEGRALADQAFEHYFERPHPGSTLDESFFLKILRNRDIAGIVRHLDMMDREELLIDAQKPVWRDSVGAAIKEAMQADRQRYKRRAGLAMLREMSRQYEYIGDLIGQSEIIRFEVVDAQRVDYQYRASNPLVESAEERTIDFATSRDVIYWPFNGEFWDDELGYYRYTEHTACE